MSAGQLNAVVAPEEAVWAAGMSVALVAVPAELVAPVAALFFADASPRAPSGFCKSSLPKGDSIRTGNLPSRTCPLPLSWRRPLGYTFVYPASLLGLVMEK